MSKHSDSCLIPTVGKGESNLKNLAAFSPRHNFFLSENKKKTLSGERHKLYHDLNNSYCYRSVKKRKMNCEQQVVITPSGEDLSDSICSERFHIDEAEHSQETDGECVSTRPDNREGKNDWEIEDISSGCESTASPLKKDKIRKELLRKFASPISAMAAFRTSVPNPSVIHQISDSPFKIKTQSTDSKLALNNFSDGVENRRLSVCSQWENIKVNFSELNTVELSKVELNKQALKELSRINYGSSEDSDQETEKIDSLSKLEDYSITDVSPCKENIQINPNINKSLQIKVNIIKKPNIEPNSERPVNNAILSSGDSKPSVSNYYSDEDECHLKNSKSCSVNIDVDKTPVSNSDDSKAVYINDESPEFSRHSDGVSFQYGLKKRLSVFKNLVEDYFDDYSNESISEEVSEENKFKDNTPEGLDKNSINDKFKINLVQFGKDLINYNHTSCSINVWYDDKDGSHAEEDFSGLKEEIKEDLLSEYSSKESTPTKSVIPYSIKKSIKTYSTGTEFSKSGISRKSVCNLNNVSDEDTVSECFIDENTPTKITPLEISQESTPSQDSVKLPYFKPKLDSVSRLSSNTERVGRKRPKRNNKKIIIPTNEYWEEVEIESQIDKSKSYSSPDRVQENSQDVFIDSNTPKKIGELNILEAYTPTKNTQQNLSRNEHIKISDSSDRNKRLDVSTVKTKRKCVFQDIDESQNNSINLNQSQGNYEIEDIQEQEAVPYDINCFASPSEDVTGISIGGDNFSGIPLVSTDKQENKEEDVIFFSRRKKRLLKSNSLLAKAVSAVNSLKAGRKMFSYELQVRLRNIDESSKSDLLSIDTFWKNNSSYYFHCKLFSRQTHSLTLRNQNQLLPQSIILIINERPTDIKEDNLIRVYYPVQIFYDKYLNNTLIGIPYYIELVKNNSDRIENTNLLENDNPTNISQSFSTRTMCITLKSSKSDNLTEALANSCLKRYISLKLTAKVCEISNLEMSLAGVDSNKELCLIKFISEDQISEIKDSTRKRTRFLCFIQNLKIVNRVSNLEVSREHIEMRSHFDLWPEDVEETNCFIYNLVPSEEWSYSQDFVILETEFDN